MAEMNPNGANSVVGYQFEAEPKRGNPVEAEPKRGYPLEAEPKRPSSPVRRKTTARRRRDARNRDSFTDEDVRIQTRIGQWRNVVYPAAQSSTAAGPLAAGGRGGLSGMRVHVYTPDDAKMSLRRKVNKMWSSSSMKQPQPRSVEELVEQLVEAEEENPNKDGQVTRLRQDAVIDPASDGRDTSLPQDKIVDPGTGGQATRLPQDKLVDPGTGGRATRLPQDKIVKQGTGGGTTGLPQDKLVDPGTGGRATKLPQDKLVDPGTGGRATGLPQDKLVDPGTGGRATRLPQDKIVDPGTGGRATGLPQDKLVDPGTGARATRLPQDKIVDPGTGGRATGLPQDKLVDPGTGGLATRLPQDKIVDTGTGGLATRLPQDTVVDPDTDSRVARLTQVFEQEFSINKANDMAITAEHKRVIKAPKAKLEGPSIKHPEPTTVLLAKNTTEPTCGAKTSGKNAAQDNKHDILSYLDKIPSKLLENHTLELLNLIGQGQFGNVYKAKLRNHSCDEETLVAVKTLNLVTAEMSRRACEEAVRMHDLEHPHVLPLVGVALGANNEPYIVLPYMERGSLLDYLLDLRNSVTLEEKLDFGLQVAKGMCYLAECKLVHRDLAARNCMLGGDGRVRVADFGLTRNVMEQGCYRVKSVTTLPIWWMAIESLQHNVFTFKSDVWSYGVVLWELMTSGQVPYSDMKSWALLFKLVEGYRLPQPEDCPEPVYRLMLRCWADRPCQRPDFPLLVQLVGHLLQQRAMSQSSGHHQ